MEKLLDGKKDIEDEFYSNDFANYNLESKLALECTHTVSLLMLYSAQTIDEPLAFHMSMEDYCFSLIQNLLVKLFEDGDL